MSAQTRRLKPLSPRPSPVKSAPEVSPSIVNRPGEDEVRTPAEQRVRVNQTLRGRPAQIIMELKSAGYYRTTSQAINEAVIVLGDIHVERRLKFERVRRLEDEEE